jgi:hypothetical protein
MREGRHRHLTFAQATRIGLRIWGQSALSKATQMTRTEKRHYRGYEIVPRGTVDLVCRYYRDTRRPITFTTVNRKPWRRKEEAVEETKQANCSLNSVIGTPGKGA